MGNQPQPLAQVIAARVGESRFPEPGSKPFPCSNCEKQVLVGPQGQELLQRGGAVAVCIQCATARDPDFVVEHPYLGAVTLREMLEWTKLAFPDSEIPDGREEVMAPTQVMALLRHMRCFVTERTLEFVCDPELAYFRARVAADTPATGAERALRKNLVEFLGVLGDPGPRLGLLVSWVEAAMNLVDWPAVAAGLEQYRAEAGKSQLP